MDTDYDAVIDALTDDNGDVIDGHVTLRFVGEKLIDGRPHALDDFKTRYKVPINDLQDSEGFWQIRRGETAHYVQEPLKTHPNAPELVTGWDGPYTIMVDAVHPASV